MELLLKQSFVQREAEGGINAGGSVAKSGCFIESGLGVHPVPSTRGMAVVRNGLWGRVHHMVFWFDPERRWFNSIVTDATVSAAIEIDTNMSAGGRFVLAFTPREAAHAVASFPKTVYRFSCGRCATARRSAQVLPCHLHGVRDRG
jgi:hypothetical protein